MPRRLRDRAAGLPESGVIDGDTDELSRAEGNALFQEGSKQGLRIPRSARVQQVFAGPSFLLTPVGPQNPRQSSASEHQQSAQSLPGSAHPGALLNEDRPPG